ncbi:MAG: hypothetical protein HOP10_10305 [Chitinophagaceae bacterium]|nr:hypothetical protein [Chitinophagaceae bacterium]
MKTILLFFSLTAFFIGNTQVVINVDNTRERLASRNVFNTGFPVPNVKYVRLVSGSPYFSETWMKSEVVNDTTIYNGPVVRLDLLEGTLVYLNDYGEELTSDQVFTAVSLTDTITSNNYLFVHSSYIAGTSAKEKTWYQLLTGQRITLFKQYYKRMMETKPFASSVTEQTIVTEIRYFIAVDGKFSRIKTSGDIANLVVNNKQALKDHVKKNNLNASEEDLLATVEYYDTLKKHE